MENENYWKSSDFIVDRYNDFKERQEVDQIYNLSFFRNEIIQGILSTQSNLISVEEIRIITTNIFKNEQLQSTFNQQDIEEILAINDAFRYLEDNIDKPLTLEIIKNYNRLVACDKQELIEEELINNGLKTIDMLQGNINKAFSYLLMISKLQVFIDGNKRTALLSAIHHLAYTKQPLLMFFSDFTQAYLQALKKFYETGDNNDVSDVLYKQLDINR